MATVWVDLSQIDSFRTAVGGRFWNWKVRFVLKSTGKLVSRDQGS